MSMFTEGRIKSLKVTQGGKDKYEVEIAIDPTAPFAFEYNGCRYTLFVEDDGDGRIKNGGHIESYAVRKYFNVFHPFVDALVCAKTSRSKCRFCWKKEEVKAGDALMVEFI